MPYTAADARREFKPRLRRYNVLLLGQRLGLTQHTTRILIESGEFKPIRYGNQTNTHAYYDLENALTAMLPAPGK